LKIAITGHRALSEQVERYVDAGICSEPVTYDQAEIVGLSCLADGADQIFAHVVPDGERIHQSSAMMKKKIPC